jgi:hypothetical protein
MSLPPLPPEFAEPDERRAPPGFGMLIAFGISVLFWVLMLLIAAWWH